MLLFHNYAETEKEYVSWQQMKERIVSKSVFLQGPTFVFLLIVTYYSTYFIWLQESYQSLWAVAAYGMLLL